MSHDPRPQTVISFGEPARQSLFRDLSTDRRLPALVAALGGVAAFGSLISEWQTTTMEGLSYGTDSVVGDRILSTEVIDLGAVGAGYLSGLLLLATAVVLTLFGPAPGRRYARLAGFATGGVLLALLLALVHYLNETSLLIPRYYTLELSGNGMRVAHGRGLWCALAGVTTALIALRLPERDLVPEEPVDPRPPARDDPLDLSISPTTPFASFPGELDRPHRS